MSGGFFRGTSADQDTRFSNKQAKLLKTQKFPPELDHLVDTTKVKMDVMKPWIAKRVTELLGFEDEVLINFVYGLLEAKEVDGKQIQIQLTGFMEKNTGKFMKELWALLLSAQKNASGVPQQFLDEKEEEMKKKKAESERITQEIQKRQERGSQDASQMSLKGMDGEAETAKPTDAASPGPLKHSVGRADASKPDDERETDGRRDSRRSRQKSPSYDSDGKSPVSLKGAHAVTKSRSRSFSRSRSYSGDGRRSRDGSRSPSPVKRPRSRERGRRQTPPRYTLSPRRRRSPYAKRRSPPRLHHRSPSPIRRRSPVRLHRRSPSPRRRRSSPFNRRSRSPLRRRSPLRPHRHRRSPSPLRRKSPMRRRRSPSPKQQRISSRYSPKHHDPDLQRNPAVRRSRSPSQSRSSLSREASVSAEEAEYGPGKTGVDLPPSQSSRDDDRKRPHRVGEAEGLDDRRRPIDPDTEEKSRGGRSEKRPRKSDQRETSLEDESDDDSEEERRLESKRRKKEERRLRKEEKQRRREERHRKREERRAQKKSEGDDGFRNPSGGGSTEETENEQKKLEIELRQKALESLRAKKAVNP